MIGGQRGRLALPLLAAAVTLAAPAIARAATPVSPSADQVVTTSTPTFTVALDSTLQADGTASESSPLISVYGPGPNGQSTVVAFCAGINNGDGTWSCSDPAHPLTSGSYLMQWTHTSHSCVSVSIPGSAFQPSPSCTWLTMPGTGAFFSVNVGGSASTTTQRTTTPPTATAPTAAAPSNCPPPSTTRKRRFPRSRPGC